MRWHLSDRFTDPGSIVDSTRLDSASRPRLAGVVKSVDGVIELARRSGARGVAKEAVRRFAPRRRRGSHAPLAWSGELGDAVSVVFHQSATSGPQRLTGSGSTADSARRWAHAESVEVDDETSLTDITALAMAGAPLVGRTARPPDDAGDALQSLARTIDTTEPNDLRDSRVRELHSVTLRRAARRVLRQETSASTPSIAILLATNRPGDLDHAIAQIQAQSIEPAEVAVGLHGDAWSDADAARVHEAFGDRAIVRRCDQALVLGEVLAAISDDVSSDFVTKWDDDDWYGAHHLEDLLAALSSSGADMVGKAAEFVRLESADVVVRRFGSSAETFSTTLAGGTLLLRRSTLGGVGGWSPIPRNVDRDLIDRVIGAGGTVYRTHGFEYVLRRRAEQHTWAAPDEYFVRGGVESRPGLDLAFAGIEP